MRKHTLIATMIVVLLSQVIFSACRKSESERAKTAPEAHQQAMVRKSFEESKKVIVAKVNGEAVTMFSLMREMNAIAPQYAAAGKERTPELDQRIVAAALNTLIVQALAVQEARKRGMKVGPEVVDREITKIRSDKGSEGAFQEYLAKNGLREAELRKMLEQDALFEMIAAQEVDANITITDAALRERYKKEKAGLKDSAHRKLGFEESKGLLEQKIRAEAGEKKMREWETRLKKDARIEIVEPTQQG
jgi:hypothetical protein